MLGGAKRGKAMLVVKRRVQFTSLCLALAAKKTFDDMTTSVVRGPLRIPIYPGFNKFQEAWEKFPWSFSKLWSSNFDSSYTPSLQMEKMWGKQRHNWTRLGRLAKWYTLNLGQVKVRANPIGPGPTTLKQAETKKSKENIECVN